MTPDDIELIGTQELIDELMRRTTFMGIVIHAEQEARSPWQDGERTFRVHFNENLEHGEVGRLLSVLSEHLDRHCA